MCVPCFSKDVAKEALERCVEVNYTDKDVVFDYCLIHSMPTHVEAENSTVESGHGYVIAHSMRLSEH